MRMARMGQESGFFIDVHTTSQDLAFKTKLFAALERISVSDHLPMAIIDLPQIHAKEARGRSITVLVIDEPDLASAGLLKSIASMTGDQRLILVQSDEPPVVLTRYADKAVGIFVSRDLGSLLQPIRQLTASGGLIGIDLADFFSVWGGQLTRPLRVQASELQDAVASAPPFNGAVVTFPSCMSLSDIDHAIDTLKRVLAPSSELVWQDLKHTNEGLCDVGLAYPLVTMVSDLYSDCSESPFRTDCSVSERNG